MLNFGQLFKTWDFSGDIEALNVLSQIQVRKDLDPHLAWFLLIGAYAQEIIDIPKSIDKNDIPEILKQMIEMNYKNSSGNEQTEKISLLDKLNEFNLDDMNKCFMLSFLFIYGKIVRNGGSVPFEFQIFNLNQIKMFTETYPVIAQSKFSEKLFSLFDVFQSKKVFKILDFIYDNSEFTRIFFSNGDDKLCISVNYITILDNNQTKEDPKYLLIQNSYREFNPNEV